MERGVLQGNAGVPSRPTEISTELNILAEVVTRVEKDLDGLFDKLKPIRTSKPECESDAKMPPEPQICTLAIGIKSIRTRLETVNSFIKKVSEEIEL